MWVLELSLGWPRPDFSGKKWNKPRQHLESFVPFVCDNEPHSEFIKCLQIHKICLWGVILSKEHSQREGATGNTPGSHKTISTTTTKAIPAEESWPWSLNYGIISVSGELSTDSSFNTVFFLCFVWNSKLGRHLWALLHCQVTQGPPLCACASPQLPVNVGFVLNK